MMGPSSMGSQWTTLRFLSWVAGSLGCVGYLVPPVGGEAVPVEDHAASCGMYLDPVHHLAQLLQDPTGSHPGAVQFGATALLPFRSVDPNKLPHFQVSPLLPDVIIPLLSYAGSQ